MIPNFLYIGPDKAGSSWMHQILKNHPDCYVPEFKDIYFFDRYYNRGFDWYMNLFKNAPVNVKAIGELSHDYLFSSLAAERIKRHLPDIKLFATMREPVERSFSHYLYLVRSGLTKTTFEQAIKDYPEIIEHSCYDKYLPVWIEQFGKEKLKILFFDDLKNSMEDFAFEIFNFIGVSHDPRTIPLKKIRAASYPRFYYLAKFAKWGAGRIRDFGFPQVVGALKHSFLAHILYGKFTNNNKPSISNETRTKLADYFHNHILELQKLTGKDLSRWLIRYEGIPA